MISIIYRSYYVDGKKQYFAIRGDASINKEYRGQGIGKLMYSYLSKYMDNSYCPCSIGLPNPKAAAAAQSVGYKNIDDFIPLTYLFDVRNKLKIEENTVFSNLIGTSVRYFQKLRLGLKRTNNITYEFTSIVDSSFHKLWELLPKDNSVLRDRSRETLIWRYQKHPTQKFVFFKLKVSNELVGYFVFHQKKSCVIYVYDIILIKHELLKPSISLFLKTMMKTFKKVESIRIYMNEKHPYYKAFLAMGFIKRERESAVVAHFNHSNFPENKMSWYVTLGDKDI